MTIQPKSLSRKNTLLILKCWQRTNICKLNANYTRLVVSKTVLFNMQRRVYKNMQ